ncbi:MAG: hypothetical protein RLZZ86_3607, partial [Cyanobacteriota bacterium]
IDVPKLNLQGKNRDKTHNGITPTFNLLESRREINSSELVT